MEQLSRLQKQLHDLLSQIPIKEYKNFRDEYYWNVGKNKNEFDTLFRKISIVKQYLNQK